jgi:hypothetical protein
MFWATVSLVFVNVYTQLGKSVENAPIGLASPRVRKTITEAATSKKLLRLTIILEVSSAAAAQATANGAGTKQ